MTGFETFLTRITGIPRNPTAVDVVEALTLYRKSMRKKRPGGFAELKSIRDRRMKPSGRIVVTDDRQLAEDLRDDSDLFPILIAGFADYDFSPLYGLDVLYLVPDTNMGAIEIAHQIADVGPKAFALLWPANVMEDVLWK